MISDKEKIKEIDRKISLIKNKNSDKHSKFYTLSTGLHISIELVSGVIVGFCVGYTLNELFDFGRVFLISLTIMGGIAGFFNVARYLKHEEEDKES